MFSAIDQHIISETASFSNRRQYALLLSRNCRQLRSKLETLQTGEIVIDDWPLPSSAPLAMDARQFVITSTNENNTASQNPTCGSKRQRFPLRQFSQRYTQMLGYFAGQRMIVRDRHKAPMMTARCLRLRNAVQHAANPISSALQYGMILPRFRGFVKDIGEPRR